VTEAIQMELDGIANAVKECFAPDTAGTFYWCNRQGIVMSGGTSLLRNIDKLITQVTGVSAYVWWRFIAWWRGRGLRWIIWKATSDPFWRRNNIPFLFNFINFNFQFKK
jgi:hypothetical protein